MSRYCIFASLNKCRCGSWLLVGWPEGWGQDWADQLVIECPQCGEPLAFNLGGEAAVTESPYLEARLVAGRRDGAQIVVSGEREYPVAVER